MQKIVRSNGMVHVSLPLTQEDNSNRHKKELNVVNENMASRLAAITKALKNHTNGVITKTREIKASSINGVSLTTGPSISSPDYITKHCTGLVKQTVTKLSSSQSEIEHRVSKSLLALRNRQLALSNLHSIRQIESQVTTTDNFIQKCQEDDSTFSNEATPPSGSPNTSIHSNHSSINGSFTSCMPDSSSHENMGVASFTIEKHLQGLGSFVDDEATCSSSDEEEDDILMKKKRPLKQPKLNLIQQRWNKDRAHIGSQWAWLCHQITSVNQKIFQLDTLLKSSHPKESVQLVPHSPFSTSCICGSIQNNDTRAPSPTKLSTNGQYNHHQQLLSSKSTLQNNRSCVCQIKQMILANPTIMTQQLPVKDLLGYSLPALLMEESSQTCARTRLLRHAPKRKLLRIKRKCVVNEYEGDSDRSIDPAYHPFLSQLTDLSSSLWLDKGVHQILQEHSYASFPVQKRRKLSPVAISDHTLAHISSSLRLERSKSFSPSPTPLDVSIERIGKGIPRKRNSTNTHSFSDDSTHMTTPTLPRKRKSTTTPQYDIDNIIIPSYSMASSNRLEKLEYKEIITPKWQKKSYAVANGNGVSEWEEEDISDNLFQTRHAKCEQKEKNRYLCFIGGNGTANINRKRLRPTRSSTPESSNNINNHGPTINMDHDCDLLLQVLPYPPRKFPLVHKELLALDKPGPPPKRITKYVHHYSSSSPSPIPYNDKSQTPLGSLAPSPLSSPLTRVSTPPEVMSSESPLSITSKWTVVNGGVPGTSSTASLPNQQSSGLVLKLSKRI